MCPGELTRHLGFRVGFLLVFCRIVCLNHVDVDAGVFSFQSNPAQIVSPMSRRLQDDDEGEEESDQSAGDEEISDVRCPKSHER